MTEQPQPPYSPAPQPALPVPPQPMLESDARMWSMFTNLATVIGVALTAGTLQIVAVLVIWLVYRERSALVDFHGKQQVNLNITLILAAIAATIGSFVTLGLGIIPFFLALSAYGIYLFVISILAAVAANRGEYYRIPGIIRFIK